MNLETNNLNALIELKDVNILEYLKWMEYIPEHWNLNNILGKNASELTDSDLRILNIIKKEQQYIEIFKQYLIDKKEDNKYKILNYINKISIEEYAKLKLNKEELEFCNNAIKMYLLSDLNIGIRKLKNIQDRSMKEEYILKKLLLKKSISNKNKEKIKK